MEVGDTDAQSGGAEHGGVIDIIADGQRFRIRNMEKISQFIERGGFGNAFIGELQITVTGKADTDGTQKGLQFFLQVCK